jgi:hypothetical protein
MESRLGKCEGAVMASERSMTKKQIQRIIDAELAWCKENRGVMSADYERGYMNGLRQIKRLVKELRDGE